MSKKDCPYCKGKKCISACKKHKRKPGKKKK
jgi:hypothetical protein